MYPFRNSVETPTKLKEVFVVLKLENVEHLNYFGSKVTNDVRCTRGIKFRIAMTKAAFNKEKTLFTGKLD
jgi:hypothetical protein